MMSESKFGLSVAIPTWRRPGNLTRLLNSIFVQVEQSPTLKSCLQVYVYDNDSRDATPDVVAKSGLAPIVHYRKNPSNLGGQANILQAYTATPGDYIWVCGDDDMLLPGSLVECLDLINTLKPTFIINRSNTMMDHVVQGCRVFENYLEMARQMADEYPFFLVGHTLITRNIVKAGVYDLEKANSFPDNESYKWLYGLVHGVLRHGGKVVFPENIAVNCAGACQGAEHEMLVISPPYAKLYKDAYSNYGDWIFNIAGRKDIEVSEMAHKYRVSSVAKCVSLALAKMAADGIKTFCIYGAGAHTRTIFESGLDFSPMRLTCVIDDNPAIKDIMGHPISKPSELDVATIDAALISSDAYELRMEAKLRKSFPKPIYLIYRDSPIAPCLTW